MSADEQELRAVMFLALRVRRSTSGAGPWDEHGLMTNLRKIQNRNLHMLIEHVIRHAADPAAKSPGVLAGTFTPTAPKLEPEAYRPPKKSESCQRHPGQWADNCGGCNVDPRAWDGTDSPPARPVAGDHAAGKAAALAAMGGEQA